MRAVVAVQSSGGGGARGASRAARYISERDRDPEREGDRPRSLFSDRDGDLSYRKADRFLGNGAGAPDKNDLIHFSVSFRGEDYEGLGSSDTQRRERLREVAREAMEGVKDDLGASDLRWVAGIHLNTEHPHLHILVHKEITDREKAEARRLGRLPKRMLPHREPNPGGVPQVVEGGIGECFVAALDRAQQRARELELEKERESRSSLQAEERVEPILSAEERLLDAARYNPSIAGRDLVQEIILRGSEPEGSPDAADLRAAFRNASLDDPDYRTRPEQADWLNRRSQELRDLYERGASVKGDVLIIPAEEHELPADRDQPFLTSLSYALGQFQNPETAREFHTLARSIAGETADPQTEIEVFRHYYGQIGQDAATLDVTIGEMRLLAAEMAKLETRESVEAVFPMAPYEETPAGYRAFGGNGEANEDQEAEELGYAVESDLADSARENEELILENDREAEVSAARFNTAARKVRLNEESLRFPAGLSVETRERLVRLTIPAIDSLVESGTPRSAIHPRIDAAIFHKDAPETDEERRGISGFLKAYVDQRLKDPETRALNQSAPFRQAHARIIAARTPEELNRVAEQFLRQNLERSTALRNGQSLKPDEMPLNARERSLLFFGRAPDHHTAEMRELRHAWGLSRAERAERVEALRDGRRAPSPTLERMLAELESRRSVSALRHYQASILNEEMRNPGKLNLRQLYERLSPYERTHLVEQIEGRKQRFTRTSAPAPELAKDTSSRPVSVAPRESESYQEYMAGVADLEQRLLREALRQREPNPLSIEEARALLPAEEQAAIRHRACNLAWERLALPETFDSEPGSAARQLGDAIAQLQEETQPRARLAAQALDDFLREKVGTYSRNGQSHEAATSKLSPADAEQLKALEAFAAGRREELYRGFESLDRLRREVEASRAETIPPTDREVPDPAESQSLSQWFREVTQAYCALDSWNHEPRAEIAMDSETLRDRHLLGQTIQARVSRELAEFSYNLAVESGDTFRFEIRDQSVERPREISAFDVHRRADARGARTADEGQIHAALERRAARQQTADRDLALHAETLHEHAEIRERLTQKLEKDLAKAVRAEAQAEAKAGTIRRRYADREESPPAPLLNRDTLSELQEKAAGQSLVERVEQFEVLRLALAAEHGQPPRTETEAGRLAAQFFTAHTELEAREERAARFDQTRHLRQWEIGDEKWSLADLDRRIERQTDDAKLLGRYQIHLDPAARQQAGEEMERLVAIRETVIGRIAAEQQDLQAEVQDAGRMLDALTRIHERESAFRAESGQAMPEPLFTRKELERVAANIETTRDAARLRQLHEFERRLNAYGTSEDRRSPERELGRAFARETMADISLRESGERVAHFQSRSELQPLLVETPDGGLLTRTLQDSTPRSLAERVLRPLIEAPGEREQHDAIRAAFAQYRDHLLAGHDKSLAYHAAAREIAGLLHAQVSERAGTEKIQIGPEFTAKEEINLEIYAERLTDPNEREHYLRLARGEAVPALSAHNLIGRDSGPDRGGIVAELAHEVFARGAGRGR